MASAAGTNGAQSREGWKNGINRFGRGDHGGKPSRRGPRGEGLRTRLSLCTEPGGGAEARAARPRPGRPQRNSETRPRSTETTRCERSWSPGTGCDGPPVAPFEPRNEGPVRCHRPAGGSKCFSLTTHSSTLPVMSCTPYGLLQRAICPLGTRWSSRATSAATSRGFPKGLCVDLGWGRSMLHAVLSRA